MNLGMAVRAAPIEHVVRSRQLRGCRVTGGRVTFLAEPGRIHLEQRRAGRAVGLVANVAILHHRGMLPKERATPLGMALVTSLVDGSGDEHFGIRSAMRVMAVRARECSL